MCAKLLQWCLILCDPMDCSLPGSSVHGILRPEYCSGGSCPPLGDLPDPGIEPVSLMSPALAGRFFTKELWQMVLSPANARDAGLIPGSGRSSGEGGGYPLQFFSYYLYMAEGVLCSSNRKESACNARDQSSIPGSGRSSGKRIPLQY